MPIFFKKKKFTLSPKDHEGFCTLIVDGTPSNLKIYAFDESSKSDLLESVKKIYNLNN